MSFNFCDLKPEDLHTFLRYVGELRDPDEVIAPDGQPYLYRWFIVPPKSPANVYFHIQVGDDPDRPLHDHPWDNTSVILAGGYKETMSYSEGPPVPVVMLRQPGDVIHRRGSWPHRLQLLRGENYTMTLFTTGPKNRDWGFWTDDGWVKWDQFVSREIVG